MRALVTGAGKRLGRAMALYLADRGYDVAAHFASSETAAQSLVLEIIAKGRQSVALQADLLQENQVQIMFGVILLEKCLLQFLIEIKIRYLWFFADYRVKNKLVNMWLV